ncbi:hypothetical protein J7L09_02365 [bacterium]|nr:hypothetical protein [bacterium]
MAYINLLPKIEQEKREREKTFRLILILGVLITSLTLFFVLAVFVAKIQLGYKASEQQAELQAARLQLSQVEVLEKRIRSINSTLGKINRFYNEQIFASEVVNVVTSYLEPQMKIKSFYLNPETGEGSFLGYAPSMEALEKLRTKLKEDGRFSKIDIEITGFVKTKDVSFRLNFSWLKNEG